MSSRSNPSEPLCALGFDVGAKRTGVALANSLTMSARALTVIEHADESIDWPRLEALRKEWQPDVLVIGEPLTLDGSEQLATERARRFGKKLAARFQLPVVMIDERSSSKEANARFAQARATGQARRRDAVLKDARAAQIILERWLDAGMPIPEQNS